MRASSLLTGPSALEVGRPEFLGLTFRCTSCNLDTMKELRSKHLGIRTTPDMMMRVDRLMRRFRQEDGRCSKSDVVNRALELLCKKEKV